MKHFMRWMAVFVVLTVAFPVVAFADVRPSESPDQDEREASETPEPKESEEPEDIETPEVSVPPELEDDADEITGEDDSVKEIKVDKEDGTVEVSYELHAKLFGFIEVPYELEAKVEVRDGQRNIEAKGPWWLAFAADNSDEVLTALNAESSLKTATNQGTILSKIISILKSMAN